MLSDDECSPLPQCCWIKLLAALSSSSGDTSSLPRSCPIKYQIVGGKGAEHLHWVVQYGYLQQGNGWDGPMRVDSTTRPVPGFHNHQNCGQMVRGDEVQRSQVKWKMYFTAGCLYKNKQFAKLEAALWAHRGKICYEDSDWIPCANLEL